MLNNSPLRVQQLDPSAVDPGGAHASPRSPLALHALRLAARYASLARWSCSYCERLLLLPVLTPSGPAGPTLATKHIGPSPKSVRRP